MEALSVQIGATRRMRLPTGMLFKRREEGLVLEVRRGWEASSSHVVMPVKVHINTINCSGVVR